jgi:N-acetylmuramoyl-L-alanine amidase
VRADILTRLVAPAVAAAAVIVAVILVANVTATPLQVGSIRLAGPGGAAADPNYFPAGAPLGMIGTDPDDPDDPWSAAAPPGGAILQTPGPTAGPNATSTIRIPAPRAIPTGPRRVGIQAGHWKTDEAPAELRRLEEQTGAEWEGITEVEINLDIAQRVAVILNSRGIAVDLLPTTIPQGYLADAFVALHGDSDGVGQWSGFKLAHGSRRGPHEAALLASMKEHYGAASGLRYDAEHVSRNMTGYFGFSWSRFQHAVAPHTPAIILEMGYVSHDHDRTLMVEKADVLAAGVAEGVLRFLSATPREAIFGQDLVVPAFPSRRSPSPSPSPP